MTQRRLWWIVGMAAFVTTVAAGTPAIAQTTTRVAYVTATGANGAPVSDLTAADLVVKEGGKEQPIQDLRISATPLNIALLVEESLSNDTRTKEGLLTFVRRFQGKARIALFVVGRANRLVINYTTDVAQLTAAIISLSFTQATFDENLVGGIADAAKHVAAQETGRPVVVAVAIAHPQESVVPLNRALSMLQDSGATFYAATVTGNINVSETPSLAMEESVRDQMLDEGTKRSGGRRKESLRTDGFAEALTGIANELVQQYAVTYVLPQGVQRSERLSIASKRRGVSVRAATHIPGR